MIERYKLESEPYYVEGFNIEPKFSVEVGA